MVLPSGFQYKNPINNQDILSWVAREKEAESKTFIQELPRYTSLYFSDFEVSYEEFHTAVRIRKAHEDFGYTREKFAAKLDVSVTYLAELERGRTGISVKVLIKVCK